MSATKKIAIIIGSTRTPRVGLPISQLLYTQFANTLEPSAPTVEIELLDLIDHQLPYLNEPAVPSYVSSTADYIHPHTRAWSALISEYSGFVFVTPQYNWTIPGGLKNNLDYLYHEWKGKPALVVCYGGRGGGKAGESLVQICQGLRMDVCKEWQELNLSLAEGSMKAATEKGALLDALVEKWEESGVLEKARILFREVAERTDREKKETAE